MNHLEDFVAHNVVARSVALSVVVGILGWTAHTLISASNSTQILEQHTAQLDKLWHGQAETHKDIQELALVASKLDGKVDVVNQKLDDAIIVAAANARVAAASSKIAVASTKVAVATAQKAEEYAKNSAKDNKTLLKHFGELPTAQGGESASADAAAVIQPPK